jgi:hypothetical protein
MAAQYHPMLRGLFTQPVERQKRVVSAGGVLRVGCLNCEPDMKRLPCQTRHMGRGLLEHHPVPINKALRAV